MQFGSLITAKMALEQGCEVFAVPGWPLDPRCTGTNDLIRQGAILTEKAANILGHIHNMPRLLAEPAVSDYDGGMPPIDEQDLAAARAKIIENLSPSPVSPDELVRQCHLSPTVALTVFLELKLAGRVERQAGHKVVLVG